MEIKISQDIRKFKTKDVGNFSFKEAGYIAIAMAVGFAVYRLTKKLEYAIPFVGVILIVGFFKPYGMSFVQFLRTVVRERMTTQCYINETDFKYNYDEFEELYGKEVAAYYSKEVSVDSDVNQTNASTKINKKDRLRIIT